ncbi:MAG TPA: hypothetical protein VFB04_11315 [Terriglobales bacterium]|nr:hypothetical protein [Terriglobales bacterium]
MFAVAFRASHRYGSRATTISSRQPPQHMFREHIRAGKFRALFHQCGKRVLAIQADERHIPEIDDQLAAIQLLARGFEGALDFGGPRRDQLAFQDQASLQAAFDDGNLEQWVPTFAGHKCTTPARRDRARRLRKSLNLMGGVKNGQRDMSKSVETVIDNCRRMSMTGMGVELDTDAGTWKIEA